MLIKYLMLSLEHKKTSAVTLVRCSEFAVERLLMNHSDQFVVKIRKIARECQKLLIRERPDVALGCIQ